MRSLIAILTGLHVLAHGLFGCCDHALASLNSTKGVATAECECHHPHQHDRDEHHADSHSDCVVADDYGSSGTTPHACVHAACHWVAGSTADLDHLLDYEISFASVTAFAPFPTADNTADFWPAVDSGQISAPPLRLHLALRVMQI
jgi:hypothetical protein